MKQNSTFLFNGVLLVSGTLALSGNAAPVEPWQLSAGTTTAWVDVGSSMGMYEWSLAGYSQLNQQWFWFRLDDGQQYSIDTIGSPGVSRFDGDSTLQTVYANNAFDVTVKYRLTDMGVFRASIDENIVIHNKSATSINVNFYQYSDFNLNGTPGGDVAYIYPGGAYQEEGSTAISEGLMLPDASAFEANSISGDENDTLYKLQNESDLDLNNTDYAEGDVTWAFQWDLTIGEGETVEIVKAKWIWNANVPEPSTAALLVFGLGLWSLARRRHCS